MVEQEQLKKYKKSARSIIHQNESGYYAIRAR